MDCIDMRVSLRTNIRRMKEENTKRTPITGRVRLMFKMLATIVLAIWLFSQCWLIWLFQVTLKKILKNT